MPIPVIAAAALPLLQPLAEMAGEGIASLFTDDKADQKIVGKTAQVLLSAGAQVAGAPVAPQDAAGLAQVIATDPAKLMEFQRAVNDQMLRVLLMDSEDRASARNQTVALAQAGSKIAWGAPVVSALVLGTFGVVLYRVLSMPAGQSDPNATLMLGALTTMAVAVVSYWVGSSAGSRAKDELLANAPSPLQIGGR